MTRSAIARLAGLLTFAMGSVLVLAHSEAADSAQPAASQHSKHSPADREIRLAAKPVSDDRIAEEADPLDWPRWRGPEQNGVSREKHIIDRWDPSGENVAWQSTDLATRSTPIIMRGKLYTLARNHADDPQRQGERVICADAATGKILWENKFNVYLSDVPESRIAWSCCAGDPATGRVYALGVCGYFQCLDGETGKTIWSHSLNEEFGLLTTYGGRTNMPIIDEDLAIISGVIIGWGEMAKPAQRFLAFNKHTGSLVWFTGTRLFPDDTTYSTPFVSVLGGQKAMVFGSGDGSVWAFQPRTGVPIWQYKMSMRGLNVPPLVADNKVYMGQSEENREGSSMGAVVAIDGTAGTGGEDITDKGELWRDKEVMIGRAGMLLLDGRLYGVDDSGNFYVFDAATGQQLGRRVKLLGTIMRSSLLYADGNIYACTVSAWHVLKPTEKGVKITQRLRFPEGEEIHGSPIVSHGRLYLPTTEHMYCLALPDAKVAADPQPKPPVEASADDDRQPAHVQVVPVETLIKPGEHVNYRVRLFNRRGQFLEEADAAHFTVDGPAQIDKHGRLTADSSASHSAAYIKAKVGDVTGTARVRIVPALPWKFDFSDGEIPITWVGARYRNVVRELDGNKVMVKLSTIPKGTRSQSLMGPVDLHDYTIQADIRGAIKEDKQPDIGIIAQRYTLDLMGQHQDLQVRSWTSQLERFSRTVKLPWKPEKWYTIKLRAATDGGHAVLKGKVWFRDDQEPDAWTLEATDEVGNLVGSPGLFGNAGDAEIFMDNILVTPNR